VPDPDAPVTALRAAAFTIPTDAPEADGTFEWAATTLVIAEAEAGGAVGLGYTYAHTAVAEVIAGLSPSVVGCPAGDIARAWDAMVAQVRNFGLRGVCACAISAVDAALWDLKGKLLNQPVALLLGRRRTAVPVYGSGGFVNYDDARLREQLAGWVQEDGCRWVKMKVGRDAAADYRRVKAARQAIGDAAGLFVDANGAWRPKTALAFAERVAAFGVGWFEEPVSSDDLEGLRLVRERAPAGMDIAAGEYGFEPFYFHRMLAAEAVDVLQIDATRALGLTGFLRAADLADARNIPISSHCAPALHLHLACHAPRMAHMEWFHDHARLEALLFDGAPKLHDGVVRPDMGRPGLGLEFKRADAERCAAR
jgi:L-alanine-DL-glutamate epimerase-like enolase superfamily enzyme